MEYRLHRQFSASHLGTKNFARTKRRRYERIRAVAEILDTLGCDDYFGLF
jgi:hypothetical protein